MSTSLATTDTPSNPLALLAGMDMATIDTDKLGKLLELQAQWEDRDAAKQFNAALVAFQADMPPVFKGRQETTGKYNYAAYEDIIKIARPILKRHCLAVSFSQTEDDKTLTITCTVSHAAGHSKDTPFTVPKDGPIMTRDGRKITSEAQAQGSANSYAKRYCLCNALDIVVTGEDDDGAAAAIQTISAVQAREIMDLLDKVEDREAVLTAMLDFACANTMEEIPAEKFAAVIKALKAKLK